MNEPEKNSENPILAICYDFDKTLSPDTMQNGLIEATGYDVQEFWEMSNERARKKDMDPNLSYMINIKDIANQKFSITPEHLHQFGKSVKLCAGLPQWFDRINKYGRKHHLTIEHYIISSGLKEIIEGTALKPYIRQIYACSYLYDEYNRPIWPAQVVNYTSKTQFLFRIEKQILDVNDPSVNNHFDEGDLKVPFRNIVYIGDSDTDIPCMKLVNSLGGHSIGVYAGNNPNETVFQLMKDQRIRFFAPNDYTADSKLDRLMKKIIDKTETYENLENEHLKDLYLVNHADS